MVTIKRVEYEIKRLNLSDKEVTLTELKIFKNNSNSKNED